jgi:hypothetical protein
MDRRCVFGLVAASAIAGAQLLHATPTQDAADCSESHTKWLEEIMKRMLTIKAGMTREKLLTVFKIEGGISTRARRTYVFQDCPWFKVNVDFKVAEDADQDEDGASLDEQNEDVIVKVSAPYLGYGIYD